MDALHWCIVCQSSHTYTYLTYICACYLLLVYLGVDSIASSSGVLIVMARHRLVWSCGVVPGQACYHGTILAMLRVVVDLAFAMPTLVQSVGVVRVTGGVVE